MRLLKRINQKLPRVLDILFDRSEHLRDSPSFRLQLMTQIWKEPLKDRE